MFVYVRLLVGSYLWAILRRTLQLIPDHVARVGLFCYELSVGHLFSIMGRVCILHNCLFESDPG